MEFTVGAIAEGKVTGITKFGAFVSLAGGKTGMVHISEVANTYVSDINDYLKVGQDVKVKIIAIDPAGKINLSIKKTEEQPRQPRPERSGRQDGDRRNRSFSSTPDRRGTSRSAGPQTFDDMLKQFMSDSDNKISSIKQYSEHRSKSRKR